jgi:flagellar export protein FliJ
MKFKFRLEVLRRQRKAELDVAQREYAQAQKNVRDQMILIDRLYKEIDDSRIYAVQLNLKGGRCSEELRTVDEFVTGQKVKINLARQKARELMSIEEEMHEVLVEKDRALKVLEKLKEKQKEDHKKAVRRKEAKAAEDLVIMKRYNARGL